MPPSPPIRVAFAITELDVGGAERALVQLVLGLSRAEWEPRVYCLGPAGPLASTLLDAGIPVCSLDAVYVWDAPRVIWRLRRELQQFQPAILQCFLFHANFLGRIAGWWAGVPHILAGVRVAERRSRFYGWLDRWTNGLVERNVCVSRGVALYCEQTVGLDPRKTVVIPNGVDVAQYSGELPADPGTEGLAGVSSLWLSVGRLERQKGIDILIAAIPAILKVDADAAFVIIGDGPDREALEAQGAALGISSRLRFLGRRSDVGRWLKAATALVLPSRWEGMPNVVLEAMAAGTPVIATRVEGIAELVTDGVTGLTVPAEDSGALSEVMLRLIRQSELSQQLAKSAQVLCEEEFTTAAMVRRYAALYRELVGSEHSDRIE